ncbi:MAG: TetR/AcrR family transcriptional regulator [Spirochaetota bacterium]|nr:TetR/AcrR family transcriptional regulator [Spirochaetota bacterium]OPZ35663.1 MAG: HTH-type transcriptional repressor ComR [Spirochaetes bacterium ADurb.BinA120]
MGLKERIVDESLKLFSVKGYINTSTSEIIAAAGTSKGGFYNHFKSKEELFTTALSRARKIWREKNLEGLDALDHPVDRLRRLLENYRDRYLADAHTFPGGCVFVTFAVELAGQSQKLADEVNEGFVRLRRMIKRTLDEGKSEGLVDPAADTERIAEMVFSGLMGACVMFNLNRSRRQLNASIESLIQILLEAKREAGAAGKRYRKKRRGRPA